MNPDFVQHRTAPTVLCKRPAADSKSRWDPWLENAAIVCVTLWVLSLLILHCKRSDFPSPGAPHCCCCLVVDVAGSWLPGQAVEFSHGSRTLGQTAGVLSPVTSFHAGSNEGQESLRNSVGTGARCKTLYRTCADGGLGRIRIGGLGFWFNCANSCDWTRWGQGWFFVLSVITVSLINLFRPSLSSMSHRWASILRSPPSNRFFI